MRRKLSYQDFVGKKLSAEQRAEIWAGLSQRHTEKLHERVKAAAAERKRYEPFRLAQIKMFQDNGVPVSLLAGSRSTTRATPKLVQPNIPRLRKRIFRIGSVQIVDIPPLVPSSADAFAEWSWQQEPGNPAGNIGASQVTVDGITGSGKIGIGSGGVTNSVPQEGSGTAYAYAYLGQFFSPPASITGYTEALLQITMAPWINGYWEFGVNGLSYSNCVVTASILVIVYGGRSAQYFTLDSLSIVNNSQNSPFASNQNTYNPIISSQPLTGSIAVSSEYSYGIFLEMFAYSEGSGGSWSGANVAFDLPQIQLDAVCINP